MKNIDRVSLRQNEREAIREAASLLRASFPVEEIVLFGSRSRGEYHPESDIDLLVLTTRPLSWEERDSIVSALFPLQLRWDVVLSPLIVDSREWTKGRISHLSIRSEVERDGAVV